MNILLRRTLIVCTLLLGMFAASHGDARAAMTCTLNSVTNATTNNEVVQSYNPFASTTYSYSFNFNSTCSGSGSDTLTIYFLGLATTKGSYTQPYLNWPGVSQLTFSLCVPGQTCSGGTNTWNAGVTVPEACSGQATACQTINVSGSVYAQSGQNVDVGSFTNYTQNVNFYATWAR